MGPSRTGVEPEARKPGGKIRFIVVISARELTAISSTRGRSLLLQGGLRFFGQLP